MFSIDRIQSTAPPLSEKLLISRLPVISTLFTQFRHQYANGSLTTELLNTHAEQYLVKATVTIEGQVAATALAAASNLAVADDQAKARVLSMFGFGETSSETPLVPQSTVQAELSNNTESNISNMQMIAVETLPQETVVLPLPATVTTVATVDITDMVELTDTTESNTTSTLSDSTDDDMMGRPIESFTPDEAPAPSEVPASSLAATALENFDDSSPVDLSDIIAQTDVEMARLGWSNLQGRTYLEKTFHKRSRQQLTDEELLTFLLYLESQSTPSLE